MWGVLAASRCALVGAPSVLIQVFCMTCNLFCLVTVGTTPCVMDGVHLPEGCGSCRRRPVASFDFLLRLVCRVVARVSLKLRRSFCAGCCGWFWKIVVLTIPVGSCSNDFFNQQTHLHMLLLALGSFFSLSTWFLNVADVFLDSRVATFVPPS